MSLHKVNPTGFVFLEFSKLQLCIYNLYKKTFYLAPLKIPCKICQITHFIVLSYRAWKYKANKPSFTFTTVQIRDQKSGVSGNIPGVSWTTFSGVSGHLLGVSGTPNPEFPGLYPEFPPEYPKPGVSGLIPGVSPGVFKNPEYPGLYQESPDPTAFLPKKLKS